MKKFVLSVLFALLVHIVVPLPAMASSAPAQLAIPGTRLLLSGLAAPNALVQIYDDGAIIGSVTANASGAWQKDFSAMSSGLHTLLISYEDSDSRTSTAIEEVINVRAQADTTANYFLPPTLQVLPGSVTEGDVISLTGTSVPNATVDIVVDGGNLVLRPTTDADGRFSIAFDSTGFFAGQHVAQASARFAEKTSYSTAIKTFTVLDPAQQTADRGLEPPTITSPPVINTADQSVTIRGTAPPLAQIIVYADGNEAGSTFAGSGGDWFIELLLLSTYSEISSVACYDAACSEQSNRIEINFTGNLLCRVGFQLSQYRFWGYETSDQLNLSLFNLQSSPPYDIIINWGDGTTEQFSHDSRAPLQLTHRINSSGQFNASVTMNDGSDCQHTKYFSIESSDSNFDWRWLLIALPPTILLLLYGLIRLKRRAIRRVRSHATKSVASSA